MHGPTSVPGRSSNEIEWLIDARIHLDPPATLDKVMHRRELLAQLNKQDFPQ
jgi:hypothetical protein